MCVVEIDRMWISKSSQYFHFFTESQIFSYINLARVVTKSGKKVYPRLARSRYQILEGGHLSKGIWTEKVGIWVGAGSLKCCFQKQHAYYWLLLNAESTILAVF